MWPWSEFTRSRNVGPLKSVRMVTNRELRNIKEERNVKEKKEDIDRVKESSCAKLMAD